MGSRASIPTALQLFSSLPRRPLAFYGNKGLSTQLAESCGAVFAETDHFSRWGNHVFENDVPISFFFLKTIPASEKNKII